MPQKVTIVKKALIVIGTFILGFVSSFALAATFSTLWGWFVAPQYGQGPRYSTWFGLSTIASIVLNIHLASLRAQRHDTETWMDILARVIGVLAMLPIWLLISWCTGKIFGWL